VSRLAQAVLECAAIVVVIGLVAIWGVVEHRERSLRDERRRRWEDRRR
jgi:hypothetical protein